MVRHLSSLFLERKKSLVFEGIPMVRRSLIDPSATLGEAWRLQKPCRCIVCMAESVAICLTIRLSACILRLPMLSRSLSTGSGYCLFGSEKANPIISLGASRLTKEKVLYAWKTLSVLCQHPCLSNRRRFYPVIP